MLPAGIAIRAATIDDVVTIETIVAAAYGKYIARIGRPPGPMFDDYTALVSHNYVQVLTKDNTVLGVLVLIPEPDTLLLDNVALAPEAQGRGLGRTMLTCAETTARNAGYRSIRLYTHETMTENIALYEHSGYVETHRATEAGLRRVFMAKQLGGDNEN